MFKLNAKITLMMLTSLVVLGFSAVAFGQPLGEASVQEAANTVEVARAGASGWIALAAGLGIGLAAFGGALGQGRASATALDGIARNPGASDKLFTPMILGLALIESLVIYALIISILLLGKF